MAPKIERISGGLFGATAVTRKEGAEREDSSKRDHKQQKEQEQDEPRREVDRATVEKALAELRESGRFTQNGLRAEVVETKEGIVVRMIHPNGSVIKSMNGEEFLKLHSVSVGEKSVRGNILDQKF